MSSEVTCFICKKEGHIAGSCPMAVPQRNTQDEDQLGVSESNSKASTSSCATTSTEFLRNNTEVKTKSLNNIIDEDSISEPQNDVMDEGSNTNTQKDISEETIFVNPNSISMPSNPSKSDSPIKGKRKRFKMQTQSSTESDDDAPLYQQLQCMFEDQSFISYDRFCSFLTEAKNQDDPLSIALKFTNNIDGLIQTLVESVKNITSNKLKARIKRLIKRLRNMSEDSSSQESTSER